MNKTDIIKVKRKIILISSISTSLLFMAFVGVISVNPLLIDGRNLILIGILFIIYSTIIVGLYGSWSKRLYAQLDKGAE